MILADGRVRKLRRSGEDPGCAHELTFSCYHRRPLLMDDRIRKWFVDGVNAARRKHDLELWAFVIMPEHVHILFLPRDPRYRIRGILQSIKQPVMRRALNLCHTNKEPALRELCTVGEQAVARPDSTTSAGPGSARPRCARPCHPRPGHPLRLQFWQAGGGYDRNVVSAGTAWQIVDYIHENPVRRGLVPGARDWPWSSARWYAGDGGVVLPMDDTPPVV